MTGLHQHVDPAAKSSTMANVVESNLVEKTDNVLSRMKTVFILLAVIMLLVFFLLVAQAVIYYFRWRAAKQKKTTPVQTKIIIQKETKNKDNSNKSRKSKKPEESFSSEKETEESGSEKDTTVFPSKQIMVDVKLENAGEKTKEAMIKPPTINLSLKEAPSYDGKPKEMASSTAFSTSAKESTISAPLAVAMPAFTNLKTSTPTGSLTNVAEANTKMSQSDTNVPQKPLNVPEQKGSVSTTMIVSTPPLPQKNPVSTVNFEAAVNTTVPTMPENVKPTVIASRAPPSASIAPGTSAKPVKQSPIILKQSMAPVPHVALPDGQTIPPPATSEVNGAGSVPSQNCESQLEATTHPNLDNLPNYRFADTDGTVWLPIGNAFSNGQRRSGKSKKRSKRSVRSKSDKKSAPLGLGKNKSIVKSASLTFTSEKK